MYRPVNQSFNRMTFFPLTALSPLNINIIKKELENWSERKRTLFSNDRFLDISINHLKAYFD